MDAFLHRHADRITGILTGLDRIVLRGTLREIAYGDGLEKCLTMEKVLIKDFPQFSKSMTQELVSATETQTQLLLGELPHYLPSSETNKEECALAIAEERNVTSGLICVLKSIEPCKSFDYRKNTKGHIEIYSRERRGAFFYHYGFHPIFGFMNVRIQTWLPFTIQVCLNGRTWLARQMDQIGLAYTQNDNTFSAIEDVAVAQQLMNEQLKADLCGLLEDVARYVFPQYPHLFSRFETRYNWTVYQSEVATDVMFKDADALRSVYRHLTLQGISVFGCTDAIRFLGKNREVRSDGRPRAGMTAEVTADYKERVEGIRLKWCMNSNSVKIYDKAGCVLRVETTINHPRFFFVQRPKEGGDPRDVKRRYLRRGLEDLSRRVAVSRECNDRCANALATVACNKTLGELSCPITRPAVLGKSRARGLNPHRRDDITLFAAVSRGEYFLDGFRNRDICQQLHPDARDPKEKRRHTANVTRRLRILRAHGLVERIEGTHRYRLTVTGRTIMTAVLVALSVDTNRLAHAA
jgi:hypothetical protein